MTAIPRSAASGRQPLLDLAVHHVVGERDEVEALAAHDLFEIAVTPSLGGGDADVAHTPLRLHRLQRLEMGIPIEEVVDLHEIETLHTPELARILHLVDAERLEQGPHLAGGEERTLVLDAGEAVADHPFGRAIHRRRIDQAPATIEEGLHHLGAGGAQLFVAADIEGDPGPQADGGNLLTRGRDRLFQDGPRGRALGEGRQCRRRPETGDRADECTARQMTHGSPMTCPTVAANGRYRCCGLTRVPFASSPRTMSAACGAIRATRDTPRRTRSRFVRTKTATAIGLGGLSGEERRLLADFVAAVGG